MPTIDLSDNANWATVTLTQDELWQARGAPILTTIEAPTRVDQGILLVPGAVRALKNGDVVRYKPMPSPGVEQAAILVREAR